MSTRLPLLRAGVLAAALLVAVTVAPASAAGPAAALLARGLASYEAGDYESAATDFEEVLAQGYDDATVHYDLGNASFKLGQLGRAIWHYRRASALAPRDADVRANLEYARFLALDKIEGEGQTTDRRVEGWMDRVTPREAFRLAAILWVLAGLAGVAWQLSPRGSRGWRRTAATCLVVWAVVFLGAVYLKHRAESLHEAVVLAREATVRNAPGPDFPTAFVLHDGAEVVVEGSRGEWTEISLPGDLRGWIETTKIALL